MLEHEQRSLGGERFSTVLDGASPGAGRAPLLAPSRVAVSLVLVAAGVVWAIFRGVHFYGLSPVHIAYDLDQPPLLIVLVSGWLLYRSRRR
jgi:hypothetical protein